MHICEKIYALSSKPVYGKEKGICRITGKEGSGMDFESWVKKTFNDFDFLYAGTIISNEAAFCFDEASEELQRKTGRDKLQRFRTYSHIIENGNWHCLTKADKRQIYNLITEGAEVVCLAETGQKHILFKHKQGMWQLEDLFVKPDIPLLKKLHTAMCELMAYGFSQSELITGDYKSHRIMKAGLENWKILEDEIKLHRGSGMFDFTSFMLFTDEKKEATPEPPQKPGIQKQTSLW